MMISENLEQKIQSLKEKFDKIDCTQDFQQKLDPLCKDQHLEEKNILDLLEILEKIIDKYHEQVKTQLTQQNYEGQQKQNQENQFTNENNQCTLAQQNNPDQTNNSLVRLGTLDNDKEKSDNQDNEMKKQDQQDEKQQLIQIPPIHFKGLEESLQKLKDNNINLQNQQYQDYQQNQNQNLQFIYEALRDTIWYLQELYKKNEKIKNSNETLREIQQLDQFYKYVIDQNNETNSTFFKVKIEEYLLKIKQFFQSLRKYYQSQIHATIDQAGAQELQKIFEIFKNEEKYFNRLSQNLVTLQNNLKLKQFNEMYIEQKRKQLEQNCDELVKNIRKNFIEQNSQENQQKSIFLNQESQENIDLKSKEFKNISQKVFNYLNLQFLQCVIDQKISELNQKQCDNGKNIHLFEEIKQINPWNNYSMDDLIQKLEKQHQIQDFNVQFEYKKILECIITLIKKHQLI